MPICVSCNGENAWYVVDGLNYCFECLKKLSVEKHVDGLNYYKVLGTQMMKKSYKDRYYCEDCDYHTDSWYEWMEHKCDKGDK